MNHINKLKLGIFDFTDCEGCQVELISLKEKFLALSEKVDIINWRLGQSKASWKKFDVALVEGTPLAQEEIDLLKELRKKSKLLIGLGSCATLAGIPGILNKEERQQWFQKIYGSEYQSIRQLAEIDALPLNAYVKVDFLIHGCPINGEMALKILANVIYNKKLNYKDESVCLECKLADLPCRLLEKEICLGSITQDGCGAVCLKNGSPCYGCFGIKEGANPEALLKILNKITDDKKEIERYFTMFHSKTKL